MKLRTQLLIAFCLLAILPLAAIVLYSYLSAQETYRSGVEVESAALAEEMKDRLGLYRQEVRRQVRNLDSPVVARLMEGAAGGFDEPNGEAILAEVKAGLGELAPFIERLEFVVEGLAPTPPVPPGTPQPPAPEEAGPEPDLPIGALVLDRGRDELIRILSDDRPPLDWQQDLEILQEARQELRQDAQRDAQRQALREARQEARDLGLRQIIRGSQELEMFLEEPAEKEDRARAFSFPLRLDQRGIGSIRANLNSQALLNSVLEQFPQRSEEISFAVDTEGNLLTQGGSDRSLVEKLLATVDLSTTRGGILQDGWILVSREEAVTGVRFGVIRPAGEALQKIRRGAVRNLVFGIALVGLAFLGILPLTAHITRHLSALTRGAERIAAGDLQARVPVYSENEIGQLARTFNRMAYELSENQRQLLDGERQRQEQQLQQRLLEVENHRKTQELEEARAFQLSLLPKVLPDSRGLAVAAFTRTATEVGGDYYDFHGQPDGSLTVAIGDATGHGARAGTMVAVIKSLFSSYGAQTALPRFLTDAARTIKGMRLRRMAMSLALVRLIGRQVAVSSAGMPPVLIFRAALGSVDEVLLEGMPLGGLDGYPYRQFDTSLETGDTLLLMSDGLPEMLQPEGDAVGYAGVRQLFRQAAAQGENPEDIVQALVAAVDRFAGSRPLVDDTTFVVIQVGENR